jgi:ubiquinone/menaquinone biosynthesis C-methylase UbiE
MIDPTERFSDRVEHDVNGRPTYPTAIIGLLESEFGFDEFKVIADIGSGTGISAELFLRNGNRVFGVEPNTAMRKAAERLLAQYPRFVSMSGSAEATTLKDASCDVLVAGQAFHWFDKHRAVREFRRIAEPESTTVLMWNDRTASTEFMVAYEQFIRQYSTDYKEVNHKNISEDTIAEFLSPSKVNRYEFHHDRLQDCEGLRSLVLSSSYMPNRQHARFEEMLGALRYLFNSYEDRGVVRFEYEARLSCGGNGIV